MCCEDAIKISSDEWCYHNVCAPYGDYDNKVIETIENCGYYPIEWSVDSLDWRDYGAESIVKTVSEHQELKNGAIILMHSDAKYTPEALEQTIQKVKEKGFDIVPVSELIYYEDYYVDQEGRQNKK